MKNNFIFFSNNRNVNQIKNEARKLHKSGKFNPRTEAQNYICKSAFGLSFNKTVNLAKKSSPFIDNNVLYIPLINNNRKHSISIFNKES